MSRVQGCWDFEARRGERQLEDPAWSIRHCSPRAWSQQVFTWLSIKSRRTSIENFFNISHTSWLYLVSISFCRALTELLQEKPPDPVSRLACLLEKQHKVGQKSFQFSCLLYLERGSSAGKDWYKSTHYCFFSPINRLYPGAQWRWLTRSWTWWTLEGSQTMKVVDQKVEAMLNMATKINCYLVCFQ